MAHKLSSSPPPLSQYTRGVLLGKGVSAKDGGGVYSGRDNDTSEEVAIKYMKVGAMEPFEFKQVERELCNVRSALDVPGFVRFRRALYLPGWLVIVMDLCGPALLDWINKLWLREGASSRRVGQKAQRDDGDKGSTEESLIRGVVVQVLHTLENVCLTAEVSDFNSAPAVKLIDLGLSKSTTTQTGRQTAAKTLLGTAHYVAPEVYAAGEAWSKGDDDNATYDSFKADTWALGVLVLIMLRLQYPLCVPQDKAHETNALMNHGKDVAAKGELHSTLLEDLAQTCASDAGRKFILRCFTLDPTQRPSPAELLTDPWVTAGEPYSQLPQTAAPPPGQTQSLEELNALIEVMRKELVRTRA